MNKNNALSSESRASIEPKFVTVDGLKIRYAVSPKDAAPSLLLLSPWPESIYAFSRMWNDLAREFSLVALDLPGFDSKNYPAYAGH